MRNFHLTHGPGVQMPAKQARLEPPLGGRGSLFGCASCPLIAERNQTPQSLRPGYPGNTYLLASSILVRAPFLDWAANITLLELALL